ncbi:barstar family protein [Streptomyces sp. NBC_00094]|uniref:barstar family protein n=1 Tax=Streptomyces sp. NBC_00094 TaxID=2903620 RepID=UPI00224DC1A6|nr:barstar family protein [Streptomyces sp. NBC_00094]MCX5395334.1 barstar family protein [Streptomyces sp. NBC_00094]
MVIDRGFHEVSGADIPGILDEAARQGVPVFTLATAGRTDKEAFFGAVREALPLDPSLGTFRMVWDALSDSVWGGLHELKSPRVVIVWPDARPVAGAEGDFWIALSILRDVAASLAEARDTSGRPTQVSVYVAPAPSGGEAALAEG